MTDTGHLRTSSLDEIQAEDRQSREAADIRITFLEAMAGEKLPQWQREVAKLLLDGPPYQMMIPWPSRGRMKLLPFHKDSSIASPL